MTQIIAIANPKGGVAKTITAVSLAGVLAKYNQEVLLVDLDPQAHLSLSMGINLNKVRRSIIDVIFGPSTLYNVIRESRVPGIDIIPSRPELAERFLAMPPDPGLLYKSFMKGDGASRNSSASPGSATENDQGKAALKNGEAVFSTAFDTDHIPEDLAGYDFVIMDCPPSWNNILYGALRVANLMLIPSQPEYFSTYNLKIITGIIQKVRQDINPNLAYRIVITMHDKNNPIHQELSEQIRMTFTAAVLNTVIEIDPALPKSAAAGFPISYHDPNAPSAQQYLALAQELIQYAQGS
jgi:chromosome partitioning protein